MAILPVQQGRQPPAAVLHRKRIENGRPRSNQVGRELSPLLRGNCGIEKDKGVSAARHVLRRRRLRRYIGQFASEFFKRFQDRRAPRSAPPDQKYTRARSRYRSFGAQAKTGICLEGIQLVRGGGKHLHCVCQASLPGRAGRGEPGKPLQRGTNTLHACKTVVKTNRERSRVFRGFKVRPGSAWHAFLPTRGIAIPNLHVEDGFFVSYDIDAVHLVILRTIFSRRICVKNPYEGFV